ncbi:MAG: inorganic phosphate transporter [Campylobacterota bacterium]|nr:inorganic phosphate transporter [Campylobacterota bacterium]
MLMTGYFLIWAGGYTNGSYPGILLLATAFGIFMAFNIGGNDVANSFGTSVGAGTLSIKQALVIAAIFEVSGAMIAGGEVTDTIRKGIVDLGGMTIAPMEFIYIMMSALLAAASWLLIATKRGMPVSTTHSIIGGIVGASITLGIVLEGGEAAFSLVHWDKIGMIALSWVVSPVLGGLISYLLYSFIKKFILNYNDSAHAKMQEIKAEKREYKKKAYIDYQNMTADERLQALAQMTWDSQAEYDNDFDKEELNSEYYKGLHELNDKKKELNANRAMQTYLPIVAALGSMILVAMVIFKGLKKMDLNFSTLDNLLIMGMIAALVWVTTFLVVRVMGDKNLERSTFVMFSWLQVFTASGFAFSHGSNDIANAIGPFAAILDVLRTGAIGAEAAVPKIAMLTFGVAMIAGLWFIGKHVIATVGTHLTKMHPASGFSAELAAASVVLLASTFGIPVSSTHILIGAVMGIGIVNAQANWGLMKPIALAWVITLPAAAIMSSVTFYILRSVF